MAHRYDEERLWGWRSLGPGAGDAESWEPNTLTTDGRGNPISIIARIDAADDGRMAIQLADVLHPAGLVVEVERLEDPNFDDFEAPERTLARWLRRTFSPEVTLIQR